MDMLNIESYLNESCLVITGEGCLDKQSMYNKAPIGIAKRAKKHGVPVIAIVGCLGEGYHHAHEFGIDAIIPLYFKPLPIGVESNDDHATLVALATEEAIRCMRIRIGKPWLDK